MMTLMNKGYKLNCWDAENDEFDEAWILKVALHGGKARTCTVNG
jgi:hypothetical protein